MSIKEQLPAERSFDRAVLNPCDNKINLPESIIKKRMNIKIESNISDIYFISGKYFKIIEMQKCFDGSFEIEISTNLTENMVKGILFVFEFCVSEVFKNETGNIIAIVKGE